MVAWLSSNGVGHVKEVTQCR